MTTCVPSSPGSSADAVPAESLIDLLRLCDRLPNVVLFQCVLRPDHSLRFAYISGAVERMMGVTPDQVYADPTAFQRTILDEDRAALHEVVFRAARAGRPVEHTFRQRNADGEVRWMRTRNQPRQRRDGSVVLDGITEDVTELVEAQTRLAESEARFRAFMDNSPAVAWMKGGDGRYAYISRRYVERVGDRFADWEGKTDYDMWPAETADVFAANDRAALAGGAAVEAVEPATNPDGSTTHWWVFKFPFTDPSGRRWVGGMGVDVTERVRLEGELRAKNADLEAALDKVRRLESFVTMCAWTRRVRMDGRWVRVEEFLRERFGVRVSHGVSEAALAELEAGPAGSPGPPPAGVR